MRIHGRNHVIFLSESGITPQYTSGKPPKFGVNQCINKKAEKSLPLQPS